MLFCDIIKIHKNTTNLHFEVFMNDYFSPKAFDIDINDQFDNIYSHLSMVFMSWRKCMIPRALPMENP